MASVKAMAILALLIQTKAFEWHDCYRSSYEHDPDFETVRVSVPGCGCDVIFTEKRVMQQPKPLIIKVQCENYDSNYTAIKDTMFAKFSASKYTTKMLFLSNCGLPSTFASLLASLGQANAELSCMRLDDMRGELRLEHVRGLRAVNAIFIEGAADQTRIPFDVIDALPDLENFSLRKAPLLQLEASGGDEARPPPALQSLDLSLCGIMDVPSGAFARLGNITRLILAQSLMTSFTSDAFRGLKNLENLSLFGNPITTLPSRAFEFTPRLRNLQLDLTWLSKVPGDAFNGLQHLEEISFEHVNGSIEFGALALAQLPALSVLTLDSTPLKPLPEDLLYGSIALEELKIKNASLETIPRNLFKTQHHLKKLDLSENRIKILDADVFQPLKLLDELNLDGNKIEEFPGSLFLGLSKLTTVSANNNSLKFISNTAFNTNNPIEYLYLNHNLLTSKALSSVELYYFLKELHLQGNRISKVVNNWYYFNKLKKLDLSRNNFTEYREIIHFNSYDLELDLRHNHITTVILQPPHHYKSDPTIDRFVTRILLDDNPFKCDCELYKFIKALEGSHQHFVVELKLDPELAQCASPPALAGKLIRNIQLSSLTCNIPPKDCPENCTCNVRPATESLELDCKTELLKYPDPKKHHQKSTRLRLGSIQSLSLPSHVVSLNLSGLRLTEPPSLKALQNIQELDLSRNFLTDAPVELLEANITLRLAGNRFACGCTNQDNVYALQNNADRIDDAANVTCNEGENLMRIDVSMLCKVQKAAILGGTLAAFGLLVAIIAGFAYRYSLEIKVFLFYRGWCQSCVQEDDLEDAEYDAFVSFSQEDAKWVSEQLLPKLEGEPNNYKLCVHYRDWVVGDMIPAQIATSVEQSRRTIVVLTESFLKSTWAPLEFRAANVRAQRERRSRVLVIVIGEIPDCEEMDAELRAYLSTNTYLKWGDPWFWEKLKFAMPHKRDALELSNR